MMCLMGLLLTGCSDAQDDIEQVIGDEGCRVSIRVGASDNVETKAGDDPNALAGEFINELCVFVVDGEGTITAKAAGNTEIKAVIRVNKNSEEVVLTQNLLVVREGVSLSSLTNESGKIRFTVHTGTALNSAQAVVMCSQDGRPVEIKLIPIPAIDVNGSYQAETTLTGYEQGQQIRVFLWDSLSGMKPLCQSMTL